MYDVDYAYFNIRDIVDKERQWKMMTMVDLAKKSGLNYQTIEKFLKGGRDIRISSLLKILKALDIYLTLEPIDERSMSDGY